MHQPPPRAPHSTAIQEETLGLIWLKLPSSVHAEPTTTESFLRAVVKTRAADADLQVAEAERNAVDAILHDPSLRVFENEEAISRTPPQERPTSWVILLDPHAEFAAMSTLMNHLDSRIGEIFEATPPWQATIAICSRLFSTYPSSTAQPVDASDRAEFAKAETSFRRNEFYTHIITGYRWGEIVQAEHLPAFLDRMNRRKQLLKLTSESLGLWRGDVNRLWSALSRELSNWSLHPNYFQGLLRRKNRFLDTLARIHGLGRWKKSAAEAFLKGIDSEDTSHPDPNGGVAWMHDTPGTFAMKEQLNELHAQAWDDLRENGNVAVHGPTKNDPDVLKRLRLHHIRAARRNKIVARMELYGILRDLARCLSRGASNWASASREKRDGRVQPIRVLAIKDAATPQFKDALRRVFEAAFRDGDVQLDCLNERGWDEAAWWVQKLEQNEKLNVDLEYPENSHRPPTDRKRSRLFRDYDIILLDVQYETQFLGSQLVQWLDAQFEDKARREQEQKPDVRVRRPYLFVLSRFSHFGYIHQSLNHGVEAFISKSRLFSIPPMLTVARVGRRRLEIEPRHSKPNYRTLYSLLPRAIGRQQSDQIEDLILGDEFDRKWLAAMPKADLHFHIGTSISHDTIEALALNTAGYFFGGIDPERDAGKKPWQAELRQRPGTVDDPGSARIAIGADGLLNDVCRIVVLANVLSNWPDNPRRLEPAQVVWTAARYVLLPKKRGRDEVVDPLPPDRDIYDQVVDWLTPQDKPNAKFETCSLLVAALAVFERLIGALRDDLDLLKPVRLISGQVPDAPSRAVIVKSVCPAIVKTFQRRWLYFRRQAGLAETPETNDRDESLLGQPLDLCGKLGGELKECLHYHIRRIDENWHDVYTDGREQIERIQRASTAERTARNRAIWTDYTVRIEQRVRLSVERLVERFIEVLLDKRWHDREAAEFNSSQAKPVLPQHVGDGIEDAFRQGEILNFFLPTSTVPAPIELLSLRSLVVVPQTLDPRQRTLPRYLWGAGLLGAEHLQYAENILLAGWDIVRQNVRDNVVYSEIRCSTNGYTVGGMNVYDATDILCLSFDLAAAYHGVLTPEERCDPSTPQRWVRTNVLLGAKRHKSISEMQDMVSLLLSYIRRGRETELETREPQRREGVKPGGWWQRCRVVGFDLSGDEKNEDATFQKKIVEAIEPLFVDCTPITIHAGEAATARSIWSAVHRYGAQRIGHGLRLRENLGLLRHCINRGICMELCPISNDFTNIFDTVAEPDERGRGFVEVPLGRREVYPLRFFLDEGLDACLNTDNRFLHAKSTLTDEFLRVAQLSGGLTRWEVLKVMKAGFKHAFLPKDQIAVLIRHVEFEVFKGTTDEPGGIDFPSPRDPSVEA